MLNLDARSGFGAQEGKGDHLICLGNLPVVVAALGAVDPVVVVEVPGAVDPVVDRAAVRGRRILRTQYERARNACSGCCRAGSAAGAAFC
jgi:hypothetical protein